MRRSAIHDNASLIQLAIFILYLSTERIFTMHTILESAQTHSRSAHVRFDEVLLWFAYNESHDQNDPGMKRDEGGFLYAVGSSSFRAFAESRTGIKEMVESGYGGYMLWCEDQIFEVISGLPSTVVIADEAPNLLLERTETWSAR